MAQVIAVGLVVYGVWRCLGLKKWIWIGPNAPASWQSRKRDRRRRTPNGTPADSSRPPTSDSSEEEDEKPREDESLAWYDRTLCCCLFWPLCGRGRRGSGCFGCLSSTVCRVAGALVKFFLFIMAVAGLAAIAKVAVDRDPSLANGLTDLWNSTMAKKLAERAARRHTEL